MEPIQVRVANGQSLDALHFVRVTVVVGILHLRLFLRVITTPLPIVLGYHFLQQFNPIINRKSRTVQITVEKKTHTMPVVQAFNARHAASFADKHAVSLQAMQVSVEEVDACPIVAESSSHHVMAQQALLVVKLSKDAIIPKKGSAAAAGYDLSSAVDAVVPTQE